MNMKIIAFVVLQLLLLSTFANAADDIAVYTNKAKSLDKVQKLKLKKMLLSSIALIKDGQIDLKTLKKSTMDLMNEKKTANKASVKKATSKKAVMLDEIAMAEYNKGYQQIESSADSYLVYAGIGISMCMLAYLIVRYMSKTKTVENKIEKVALLNVLPGQIYNPYLNDQKETELTKLGN